MRGDKASCFYSQGKEIPVSRNFVTRAEIESAKTYAIVGQISTAEPFRFENFCRWLESNRMAPSARPNLLYIFADQMRGMDMHCAGNEQLHTPNLDRLAEQGMRLSHAYANTPVCTASRAMLLTGL